MLYGGSLRIALIIPCLIALLSVPTNAQQTVLLNQADRLPPLSGNVLGFRVPAETGRVDVNITVIQPNGMNPNLILRCNPGSGNIPQQGNAVWSANYTQGGESILISANDPQFPNNTQQQVSYFTCTIINNDQQILSAYNFTATATRAASSLNSVQQQALLNIYGDCCSAADACSQWKQLSVAGSVNTDFCSVDGQECAAGGTLTRLDMAGWGLACPFPASDLASITSLVELDLSLNSNITGNVSTAWDVFAAMPGLQQLHLINDTGLGGFLVTNDPAVPSVCALTSLTVLDVSGMQLQGMIPECLINYSSRVLSLKLSDNQLIGPIPDAFSFTSPLQELYAYNNNLGGDLPASLTSITRLRNLDLSSNTFSGAIPVNLALIPVLENLVLRENRFVGSVPSSMLQNTQLKTVDIKLNQLTELPANWVSGVGIPDDAQLVNFRASFNLLSGPFPIGLARMPNLTTLVINNNSLSGPLPDLNGMFPALRALNASHNNFNGSIPVELGQTGIFQLGPENVGQNEVMSHVFDLSFNSLSGSVPNFLYYDVLRNYVSQGIYLQGNNFTSACMTQLQYIPNLCSGTPPPPVLSDPPPLPTASSQSPPAAPQFAPIGTASPPPLVSVQERQETSVPPPFPIFSTPVNSEAPQIDVQSQSQGGSGLGGAGIAGIVIGVVAALCLLAGVVALALRCRGSGRGRSPDMKGPPVPEHSFNKPGSKPTGASGQFSMPDTDVAMANRGPQKMDRLRSQHSGLPLLNSLGSARSSGLGFERFKDEVPGPA